MRNVLKVTVLIAITMKSFTSFGQIPTRVVSGKLMINDGSLTPRQGKYGPLADSLDKKLKSNPNDTSSLFYRALLLDRFNEQLSKPAPGEKGALENLQKAANMIEQAFALKMQDFRLKVLRAQVYKDLTYRFAGDESYKYNAKQISDRRALFNDYKSKANQYYDELAAIDKDNAYDYQKLKVSYEYPIKS